QAAQRAAVIALAPRDEPRPFRLANVYEILPGHFQRAIHLLRSAAPVKDARQTHGRIADQIVGQQFRGFIVVKHRVGELELRDLIMDGFDPRRLAVAQTRNAGAATGVQITITLAVNDVRAVAFDSDGKLDIRETWEDVAHVNLPWLACDSRVI